jgi:sensor domain CHASE-containing protein
LPPRASSRHRAAPRPADPTRRATVLDIIAAGRLTVQGPLKLKQGGVGLIARLPVFIQGAPPGDTFG